MPNKVSQKRGQSKRGFGAMPKEKVREAARKGGEHSHGGGRPSSQGRSSEE